MVLVKRVQNEVNPARLPGRAHPHLVVEAQ